ncbi:MAG: efflux RND transporter permease subunit [Alphaproteobacteria bacterium]
MDFLTKLGISRSRFTILVMIITVMIGGLLFSNFPRREDPEIIIRAALVFAQNPGLTAAEMEEQLAEPLERKAMQTAGVDEVSTLVQNGSLQLTVTLLDEVPSDVIDATWQDLRNKMAEVTLPEGSYGPYFNTDYGDVSIATVAITSDGFSLADINEVAKDFQRTLYTIEGISKVSLLGVQQEQIQLIIDSKKIGAIGLDLASVITQVQNQNVLLPSGSIIADGYDLRILTSGDFKNLEQIKNMLIRIDDSNNFIRLSDIVTIQRDYIDPVSQPVYYNGKPAVVVSIEMTSGQNITELAQNLEETYNNYKANLPYGYELNIATYQPPLVQKAVQSAVSNVLQTFAVVLAIVVIFVGFRAGFIIASIVPFAIAFAFIGMNRLGIQLESVSIAGIIISLGMLVDNGVVVVEDISKSIQKGKNGKEAAIETGKRYAIPLLVSSLTIIFAFTPMMLMDGSSGDYAFSLGGVIMVILIGSWVSSMYFLPFLASTFIKPSKKEIKKSKLAQAYGKVIETILKPSFSLIMIIGALALIFITTPLFKFIPNQMFPYADRPEFMIYMDLPSGSSTSETANVAQQVSAWLNDKEENPDIVSSIVYVGSGGPRFNLGLAPADAQDNTAFFLVNTTSMAMSEKYKMKAQRYLNSNIPSVKFRVKRLAMGAGEPGQVQLRLSGPDHDGLLQRAKQIEEEFSKIPTINENRNDWGDKVFMTQIDIDQEKARLYGLDTSTLSTLLSSYFDGTTISVYREHDEQIPIIIRGEEQDRNSISDLRNVMIPSASGLIALEQVAQIRGIQNFSSIRRINQEAVITISAIADNLTSENLYNYIQPTLDGLGLKEVSEFDPNLKKPATGSQDYYYEIRGEIYNSLNANQKLAGMLPMAFALMIAAIMFNFNSARRTLIVIMTIPLVIIGVPLGLFIFNQPYSFFGTLGIIALAGIIVNNSVVLIEAVDELRRSGVKLKDALIQAGSDRLTPILMTTSTTVLGLIPMAISGGPLFEPMAFVLMFGLAVAATLVLFYVPSFYYLLFYRQEQREEATEAEAEAQIES